MKILLLGPGSDSFPAALHDAGILYELANRTPKPGVVMNATGDLLQFLGHAIPWASIATVMVAWVRARGSRKIIVTTQDKKVIHTEGYSVEQFERILADAREVAIIDTKKSEVGK